MSDAKVSPCMCNTSSVYYIQHVVCHVVQRDSSAIKFDRVENAFIWNLFYWPKPSADEGGEETGVPRAPYATLSTPSPTSWQYDTVHSFPRPIQSMHSSPQTILNFPTFPHALHPLPPLPDSMMLVAPLMHFSPQTLEPYIQPSSSPPHPPFTAHSPPPPPTSWQYDAGRTSPLPIQSMHSHLRPFHIYNLPPPIPPPSFTTHSPPPPPTSWQYDAGRTSPLLARNLKLSTTFSSTSSMTMMQKKF